MTISRKILYALQITYILLPLCFYSGISDNIMPSDEECEIILDERRLTEIVEKEQVFDSLLNSRKKFRNSDQPSVNSAKRSRGTARPSHRSTV